MKTLKKFPTTKPAKPSGLKIDYDALFDGKVRQLDRGTDYDTASYIAREKVRVAAKSRGVKVRVAIVSDNAIVVQKVAA
jgi:hypothetical protein